MSSRFLKLLLLLLTLCTVRSEEHAILRVAADPNNLPFSNDRFEGFENRIAQLVARELNLELHYVWHVQRRGFFRETLKSGDADLVIGVPTGFDMALTTIPYYRSTYVFVFPHSRPINSLDDPRLRSARVGIQLVGDDGADTPPAHALARRGIITNIVGFTLYGDYREQNPPARIVDAVASGLVDVAVVWGPLGGYFAKKASPALDVLPVSPASEPPLRYAFNISMGVGKKDAVLRNRLNEIITRKKGEIDAILDEYGIPRLPVESRKPARENG